MNSTFIINELVTANIIDNIIYLFDTFSIADYNAMLCLNNESHIIIKIFLDKLLTHQFDTLVTTNKITDAQIIN